MAKSKRLQMNRLHVRKSTKLVSLVNHYLENLYDECFSRNKFPAMVIGGNGGAWGDNPPKSDKSPTKNLTEMY